MMSPQDLDALSGMYDAAGSLQLREIEDRYKLGRAQIKNAYKIAQLQAGSSRYATDATREIGLANIAQAREEMERVGIPRMLTERWAAEKQYEIAKAEIDFKKEQWAQQFGLQQGELTGYYGDNPTLAREEQEFQQGLAAGELTGEYGGAMTLAARQFQLQQAELARRYGLDVGKFAAELASTPDTYYQAQRFQAVDLPALMGMARQGAAAGPPPQYYGGPTPQVSRMQQYLGPGMPDAAAGTTPGGGGPGPGAGGMVYAGGYNPALGGPNIEGLNTGGVAGRIAAAGGAVLDENSPQYRDIQARMAAGQLTPEQGAAEWARLRAPAPAAGGGAGDPRARQVAQIAKAVPPSAYDGLNDTDASALRLMAKLYEQPQSMDPATYARLKATNRTGFLSSAGRLLGYDPKDLEADFQAYRPAQASPGLA